jgi:hypothetical protein
MNQLLDRMFRAAKLDPQLYEEVEADPSSLNQAVIVVVISSVAAGVGSQIAGGVGLFGGTLLALIGWLLWSGVVYLIGVKLLPEPQTQADYGQLLRTIGFSSSPGVLRLFGFVPVIGWGLNFLVGIWMLVAMVVAVRQALDYEGTGRAFVVCALGWLAYLIVFGLLSLMLAAGGLLVGD